MEFILFRYINLLKIKVTSLISFSLIIRLLVLYRKISSTVTIPSTSLQPSPHR